MIGAAWGVFVFKEFAGVPKSVNKYLTYMFVSFIIGLSIIVLSRLN
jgi:glucose uptake protein